MDLGLLILRFVVGLTLAAHGAQKLFGWFGGYGLDATGQFMETLGFHPGRRHAALAGLTEAGGGVSLALGLLTPLGVPFGVAIVLAVLAVGAFSIAVERLLYVHLYGASELDQVLLTVGINFIVVAGLTLAFGPNVLPTRLPPSLATSVDLGFRSFETYRLIVLAVGILVVSGLWLAFDRTSLGAQLRAAVDNRSMAQAIGIDVPRLFSIAFALGSALRS